MARNSTSSRVGSTANYGARQSSHDRIHPNSEGLSEQLSPRNTRRERCCHKRHKNKASSFERHTEIILVRVNEFGQPISEHASTLVTYIGVISRDGGLLPIDVKDWRRMPKEAINEVWSRVLTRFSFPDKNPRTRRWVCQKADQCWREWKYKLRDLYFDPRLPVEQQYERRHQDVHPPQWKALVDHWNTVATKVASARNKRNHACLRMNHCGRTRSIARLCQMEVLDLMKNQIHVVDLIKCL